MIFDIQHYLSYPLDKTLFMSESPSLSAAHVTLSFRCNVKAFRQFFLSPGGVFQKWQIMFLGNNLTLIRHDAPEHIRRVSTGWVWICVSL